MYKIFVSNINYTITIHTPFINKAVLDNILSILSPFIGSITLHINFSLLIFSYIGTSIVVPIVPYNDGISSIEI